MKLLVVSPKFHPIIGGGETYVLNSVKRLHEVGVDVSVAVEPHASRRIENYPFNVYEIKGLSDTNLNVIAGVAGLYKLIENLQPDIIHVHGYFALLVVGLCNSRDVPVIVSIHSTPVWGKRIIGGMESFDAELNFARSILALAKPVVLTAANEVYADAAERIVKQPIKVVVMPYPVDLNYFSKSGSRVMRAEFGVGESDRLVLTPSRIIERKGIKEIVFALNNLPGNFYLCLPGAVEPLDKQFWETICANPIYRRVRHKVIVPKRKILYDDMSLLYAASDIIAMPSYYEGAPVATVEAMAAGKPFVGADSQGINSFIRNGENGLLVPQKSILELAEAIQCLSQDQVLQAKFAKQAQQDVAHLSWENQLPLLLEAYEDILRRGRPVSRRSSKRHNFKLVTP